jgi:endonuclease YncB( thermonuclease family)
MNFKIIKGKFFVAGYSPDGDSIRFQADNEQHWDFFNWKSQSTKNSSRKQLRFEAIDALETHYEESYQPRSFGIAALEVLLKWLGIQQVVYNLSLTQIYSAQDGVSGYIASQSLDMYDRPISLVFSNDVSLNDGSMMSISALPMDKCINLKLIKLGLVYPTFYSTMESSLLTIFTKAAQTARKNLVGLWALDKTSDFTIWNTETIKNDVVILPKLFRRLTAFFNDRSDFDQLANYLAAQQDEVLVRSTNQKKNLSELITINAHNLKCNFLPEDLIFSTKG